MVRAELGRQKDVYWQLKLECCTDTLAAQGSNAAAE